MKEKLENAHKKRIKAKDIPKMCCCSPATQGKAPSINT